MTEGVAPGRPIWRRRDGVAGAARVGLVLTFYLALTLVSTYPTWLDWRRTIPSDLGDPLLNTWIIAWDLHALASDPGRLFDANIFYPLGNTLAFSENLLGTALLAWPALVLTGEPLAAYNFAFLASFLLGGLGMHLLSLRLTGSHAASLVAGVAFAFMPYRFGALGHLHVLTFQWLPFVVLFLERFLASSRARDLAGFGLCLWLQVLASLHLGVFSVFVAGVYFLVRLVVRPRPARVQYLALGAALGLVSLALLPVALPYLGVGDLQQRVPAEAAFYSARPGDYLVAPRGNHLFGPLSAAARAVPGFNGERTLFLGVVTPLLALATVPGLRRAGSRRRSVVFGWCLVLGGAAFSFGPSLVVGELVLPMPTALVQTFVPQFAILRVPARWVVVVGFGLALLASFGASSLLAQAGRRWGGWLAPSLGLVLALGVLAEGFAAPLHLERPGALAELPQAYRHIAGETDDFAIVQLPLYSAPGPGYLEGPRLYASTLHWKRLVNGYSGITPAAYRRLSEQLASFPSPASLAALRDLARGGVRFASVHPYDYAFDRAAWEREGRRAAERSGLLLPRFAAPGEYVYEINPYGAELFSGEASLADPRWRDLARRRVGASLSTEIALLGYDLRFEGDRATVELFWQCRERPTADYTVFVHLLDAQGRIVGQSDLQPDGGKYVTTRWLAEEMVRDVHQIKGPLVQQAVRVAVGLYDARILRRLPVSAAAGVEVVDDAILLAR